MSSQKWEMVVCRWLEFHLCWKMGYTPFGQSKTEASYKTANDREIIPKQSIRVCLLDRPILTLPFPISEHTLRDIPILDCLLPAIQVLPRLSGLHHLGLGPVPLCFQAWRVGHKHIKDNLGDEPTKAAHEWLNRMSRKVSGNAIRDSCEPVESWPFERAAKVPLKLFNHHYRGCQKLASFKLELFQSLSL